MTVRLDAKPSWHESLHAFFLEQINPNGMRLNGMGIACAQTGRREEAETLFREAIQAAPQLSLPKINLANILNDRSCFEEAEEWLKQALDCPHYSESKADVLYALGNCYFNQQRVQDAVCYYEAVRKVAPVPRTEAEYQLAACYEQLGERQTALATCLRAREALLSHNVGLRMAMVEQQIERLEKFLQAPAFSFRPPDIRTVSISESKFQSSEIMQRLSREIDFQQPVVFLVGAGISYPEPSSLPLASDTIRNIFNMTFNLDKDDLRLVFSKSTAEEIFGEVVSDLAVRGKAVSKSLPFEPSFKALYETVGCPALRFVDTLAGGTPNLHHYMLAHALKQGHLVITVNFDQKIEQAYAELFPQYQLDVLGRDRDLKRENERSADFGGRLVKIHGTMDDYSSVALTLDQIVKGAYGQQFARATRITDPLQRESDETVFTGSTLSESKTTFLKRVIQRSTLIVMGYSNSDFFDLRPLLESADVPWRGIWVEHPVDPHATCETLEPIGHDQFRLQTDTGKMTRYLMQCMGIKSAPCSRAIGVSSHWAAAFEQWVPRLGLVRGDGLHWLGKIYSQHGLWERAEQLYGLAAKNYEAKFPLKWGTAVLNQRYVQSCMQRGDYTQSDRDLLLKLRERMEKSGLNEVSRENYAHLLLNIAGGYQLDNNPQVWEECGSFIDQAFQVTEGRLDSNALAFAYELRGDLLFARKDYLGAEKLYQDAYRICKEITGEVFSFLSIMLALARCESYLNREDLATGLLAQASEIAQRMGSTYWTSKIALAHQRYLKWQSVLHLEIQERILADLSLPEQSEFKADIHQLNERFFTFLSHVQPGEARREECFHQVEQYLEHMLQKYTLPRIVNYLRLVRSNLAIFWRKNEGFEIATRGMSKPFQKAVTEVMNAITSMNYKMAHLRLDALSGQSLPPQVRSVLLFMKSNVYRRQNDRGNEIRTLLEYQKIQPDDPLVEHNLGVAYLALGDYPEGEAHLLRAIALMGGYYPLATFNLCLAYAESGDSSKARQQRNNLLAIGIPDPWLDELDRRIVTRNGE